MQNVGEVLHLARSGRLIIRATRPLEPGTVLVDQRGRRVARVAETIGPVAAPFISAVPLTDRIRRQIGEAVYVGAGSRSDVARSPRV